MADPVGSEYRFLPWARRGLVGEIARPDTGTVTARAAVHVEAEIEHAGSSGVDVSLYGPGDVIGLDPRVIIRCEPRDGSSDFEPNYLAGIEFDQPDLPWMFTPASASADRLRPWLALIVVERQPGVSTAVERGVPLPVLRIESPAIARDELPDLAESWMWAHGQLLMQAGDTTASATAIDRDPDLNLSRLVCPRRLRSGATYVACLVPTFDQGRDRGLGVDRPDGDPATHPLGPAWSADQTTVRLPLYFHWDFSTGPGGDFESLAARLRPFTCPDTVGFVGMHVGDAAPTFELEPDDAQRNILMDGALRAPRADNGTLADIAPALVDDLAAGLDVADAIARGATGGKVDARPVAPPIYGSWHAVRHTVPAPGAAPEWLRELNVDPRPRVAAGLGTEVVRQNQEEFMQHAWEQVGDVLAANRLLNVGRLALEASRRLHARHLEPLAAASLLQITGPLHHRVPFHGVTVSGSIAPTSLPDSAVDPAMRRALGAESARLKGAARRAGVDYSPALVTRIVENRVDLDPAAFVPDGVLGLAALSAMDLPDDESLVSLVPLGIDDQMSAATLREQVGFAKETRAAYDEGRLVARPRADLRSVGLVTENHIHGLGDILGTGPQRIDAVTSLIESTRTHPEPAALLVTAPLELGPTATTVTHVEALDVDTRGTVSIRSGPLAPSTVLGRIGTRGATRGLGRSAGDLLASLPNNSLDRSGDAFVVIRPGAAHASPILEDVAGVAIEPGDALVATSVMSATLPALVDDSVSIGRFEQAFTLATEILQLDVAPPVPVHVPFAIDDAGAALLARTHPDNNVIARVSTMLSAGGAPLRDVYGPLLSPRFDRVLAAPEFLAPAYHYLAAYDQERFCPGIGIVPPDSVTLLETNPRFIESFMVGLNHEMNRELLWRAYPTDLRGTPFRRFWDRTDGDIDLERPIHQFRPRGLVGSNLTDPVPKIVLLIRGDLLRRYPTASVFAARAMTVEGRRVFNPDPTQMRLPIFRGFFAPDATFFGFDLIDTDLDEGEGWFFVIQEQATEPRFGLDDPSSRKGGIGEWDDVAWQDTGVQPGAHLGAAGLAILPPAPAHAGAVASALYQHPVLVAVHARHMVPPPG